MKKGQSKKRKASVIILLSSSTSEEDEEEGPLVDWRGNRYVAPVISRVRPRRIQTITGIDPGTKNFSLYKYDLVRNEMLVWAWVDLNGLRRSKMTAGDFVKRIDALVTNQPQFFDSDLIVVEKQMVINTKCARMQAFLEKRFIGRCKIADPKTTKANIFELLGPKDSMDLTGHTCQASMSYHAKKIFGIKVGMAVMNAQERAMFELMRKDQSAWKDKIQAYDSKLLQRKNSKIKKVRSVKVRPDDAFDALLITLDEASSITGVNLLQRRMHWRQNKRKVSG
jgi:hypothetical protein